MKSLIHVNSIGVNEAIWLINYFNLEHIDVNTNNGIVDTAISLLDFLEKRELSSKELSIEDELFFFSIQNNLRSFIFVSIPNENDFDINDEEGDDDDEDVGYGYSKKEIEELRNTEENIINKGSSVLLEELICLIEDKYAMVFNGFNKLEYQRAKSEFWKNIGLEGYGYHALSPKAKKFLDDIYSSSEPIVRKKVEEMELKKLPDVKDNFKKWITEFNYKHNKSNLIQYLKNNSIKISNPNIDKILKDL